MIDFLTTKLSTDLWSRRMRNVGVYRWPMKKLIGRLNDWRHERHISRLTKRCLACIYAGDRVMARLWDALRLEAIRRRSPEQVERMERARGLL